MQIHKESCPRCQAAVVVSTPLWEVGTVRLRCPACAHYFLPKTSPRTRTVESATNASVPIEIWEPKEEPG